MKIFKFILIVGFLASYADISRADWTSISGHPTARGGKFYVNTQNMRKSSSGVILNHLLDLPSPQLNAHGKPYLSELMRNEYDCANRRSRSLSLIQYPGSMASGEPVAAFEGISPWVVFSIDPIARTMEEMVCGKKVGGENIFSLHPNWLSIIQSKEFLNWKRSQPLEVQQLGASVNGVDAIRMLDLYKKDQDQKQ